MEFFRETDKLGRSFFLIWLRYIQCLIMIRINRPNYLVLFFFRGGQGEKCPPKHLRGFLACHNRNIFRGIWKNRLNLMAPNFFGRPPPPKKMPPTPEKRQVYNSPPSSLLVYPRLAGTAMVFLCGGHFRCPLTCPSPHKNTMQVPGVLAPSIVFLYETTSICKIITPAHVLFQVNDPPPLSTTHEACTRTV